MSETLNHETLTQQLNTKFSLPGAAEPFELELVEITKPTVTATQTYFSLFFRGEKKYLLPQGTYQMTHQRLGTLLFFIVPVAADDNGYRYEAVFNFLNEASQKSND